MIDPQYDLGPKINPEYDLGPKDITKVSGFNEAVLPGSSDAPQTKVDPSFLETLDAINTGVHRGVTHFTLGLMSKLPFGDSYQKAIKNYDAQVEAEQQKNIQKYTGYYSQIGEVGGEILATAPLGGALGKVIGKSVSLGAGEAILPSAAATLRKVPIAGGLLAKGANAALPSLLRTPVKYGLAGAGGVATNMAAESQRYDPEQPGQLINTKAASEVVNNPLYLGLSAGLPMLGAAAGSWAKKAKETGATSDILGQGAIPRNTMKEGAKRTIYQEIFGVLPSLTGVGKQIQEQKNIGTPVMNWITKFAGDPTAMNSDDVMKYAGKTIQGALVKLKDQNQALWNAGFKTKPVTESVAAVSDVNKALNILDEASTSIPKAAMFKDDIRRVLKNVLPKKQKQSPLLDQYGNPAPAQADKLKRNFTVEELKDIQSSLGSSMSKIKLEGGSKLKIMNDLSSIYDNLFEYMKSGLDPADRAALTAAKTHSSMFFDLKSASPLVKEAMVEEVAARNLIRKLISPKEPIDKQKIFNQLSQTEQQSVAAAKLGEIFTAANEGSGFNPNTFITKVQNSPDLAPIMGSEAFKSLEGLNTYLKAVSEGSKTGWWRPTAMAVAVGIPAYLSGAGPLAGVAAVASLAAATFAANHPVLKRLFYAINKKLPENTKNAIQKAIGNQFSRAGYFIGTDGVLRHKDEEKIK